MDETLQKALLKLRKTEIELEELKKQINEPIAIVGMSCRFPGELMIQKRFGIYYLKDRMRSLKFQKRGGI